jgi:hypothetical protein
MIINIWNLKIRKVGVISMMKEDVSSQFYTEVAGYIRKIETRLKDVDSDNLLDEKDLEAIKEIYNRINHIFKYRVKILAE